MTPSRPLQAVAVAALICLASCGSDGGDSVLIGSWHIAAGANCPIDHLTFTANSMTKHVIAIGVDPAYQTVNVVSYPSPEPGKAFVQGTSTGAGVETYLVSDHDHVRLGDNDSCTFERDT